MKPVNGVKVHLEEVKRRINDAATRAGRDPASIEVMAVTKTRSEEEIREAVDAGLVLIGENRVQEAMAKFPKGDRGYRLHLIGHLQRNKARFVPGFFDCVESIDKIETAAALERQCKEMGTEVDVLLEVNTSGEQSKSGFTSANKLKEAIDRIGEMDWIRLKGLMTIAPFSEDTAAVRRSFSSLRSMFEEARRRADAGEFVTLSMGMSSDFEIAVEEGATRVRLGTVLFGERP
ncbi:MAG: YggS family pyridoxal phosphate-dependent enzyme [Spirochaetales bacterium]|nr:YggS family pyridoxal phosphate-dependent enzyme [Spirochaetales bacterium]